MSLLGLVRCRGSRTFSASSGLRMPFSITGCLTVFPVSPASFAISAAFSYPMIGFSLVAIAGLDSAYRWRTSTFAVIPSTHLCAKTRATFARSSMFCWIRCDITGIIVDRSRFEWVFATAIATSLPMTVTPTCITASGMTGLTFPGMIEEPGWTAGRFSSRKPVWGPDPSHRTTGDGRPQEDDRKGVRRAAANPDVARPALPADELREPLLLEAGPVEHGRGRGPKDPEGTR